MAVALLSRSDDEHVAREVAVWGYVIWVVAFLVVGYLVLARWSCDQTAICIPLPTGDCQPGPCDISRDRLVVQTVWVAALGVMIPGAALMTYLIATRKRTSSFADRR